MNLKRIWWKINLKSKTSTGISDLGGDPNDPKSKKSDIDEDKTNILADFLSSVFTIQPPREVPNINKKHVIQNGRK